jgi:hypothetical protein
MLPPLASLATPAGSGAIGAACEFPDTAANAKATTATATATVNRIMLSSLVRTDVRHQLIQSFDGGSTISGFSRA